MEQLDWLAKNPRYTKRMVEQVGKLCRDMTNKAVAEIMHLHEHTVKELDKQYMQEWLNRMAISSPKVIGVDELSIRKGHTYRIIVSDLEKSRPIWVGGTGRKEEDFELFFKEMGEKKSKRIRLAVMDMWKAFRNGIEKHSPYAEILYDKFHIMKHLSDAMDKVRRKEYMRVSGKARGFIKGQRYTLLSRWENLNSEGKKNLKKLLGANRRINKAYILKEQFSQLWDYENETWARKFFDNWKRELRWQRLKPFEKFANMIESHWDGIVSYCKVENKVKLGFVEGLNNKVRVIQRKAYGYRDEEYLKLKILTAFLSRKS